MGSHVRDDRFSAQHPAEYADVAVAATGLPEVEPRIAA
jgi:hypothetical protein